MRRVPTNNAKKFFALVVLLNNEVQRRGVRLGVNNLLKAWEYGECRGIALNAGKNQLPG